MIKAAIFDFDGVIADSLDFVLTKTNRYLALIGKPPIVRDFFRSHDIRETYKDLKVNLIEEALLFWKIRSDIHSSLRSIPVHEHIIKTVTLLSEDASLSILTSNSRENVLDFLKVHRIHNYFMEVHGNFLLFNKDRGLRSIVEKDHLNPEATVYVGEIYLVFRP